MKALPTVGTNKVQPRGHSLDTVPKASNFQNELCVSALTALPSCPPSYPPPLQGQRQGRSYALEASLWKRLLSKERTWGLSGTAEGKKLTPGIRNPSCRAQEQNAPGSWAATCLPGSPWSLLGLVKSSWILPGKACQPSLDPKFCYPGSTARSRASRKEKRK